MGASHRTAKSPGLAAAELGSPAQETERHILEKALFEIPLLEIRGSLPLQIERRDVQTEPSHEIEAPEPQPRESAQSSGSSCLQPCWHEQRGGAGPLSICLGEMPAKDKLAAL